MSRYNHDDILNNNTEFYSFLRKERNNIKNIQQYETPILVHPTVEQRANLEVAGHIWSVGDRYYKLAHQYYGRPAVWWVIAWYNGYPTEADIPLGKLIDIPLNLEDALLVLGM
jgi:hypothetical protein